jgi:TetR/AcrR family transcriptional repressor of adeIJK operon
MIQMTIAKVLAKAHEDGDLNCPHPNNSAMLYFGILRDYEWRIILGVDLVINEQEAINYIEYCVDRFLDGHQKP